MQNLQWSPQHSVLHGKSRASFRRVCIPFNNEVGGKQFTTNLGPRNFKEATNNWKDKLNFNCERTQSFMSPQKGSFSTYSSSYQAKLKRTISEFDSHQERRLSILGAQLGRQQVDMINKINTLWKVFYEKLDDTSTRDTAGNSLAYMNVASTDQIRKEELRSNGIKNHSKLLSPNIFREEENVKPNATKYNDHEMTAKAEEKVEEESKDEFEEEVEEEEEEDVEKFDTFPTLEELGYHEWISKYPKPSWVKAKIRTESLNNVKFSFMIGHFVKKQAYIDLESPVNVMSRLHYNWIMSAFVEKTGLIYDKKEGTVAFEDNNEKLIFKMPHKMEMFKNVDFTRVSTDRIPPFVIGGNDDGNEKTHYSDSLNLGPEYKYDESVIFDENKLRSS
ncbi:hypothetical protein Tco_1306936 [Tanacetum coccineum]